MIKELAALPNLRYLSAMKNPCVPDCFDPGKDLEDYTRYRLYVIYRLGGLTFLDDQPITAEERARAAATGKFAKTASPREPAADVGSSGTAEVDAAVAVVEDDSLTRKSARAMSMCNLVQCY